MNSIILNLLLLFGLLCLGFWLLCGFLQKLEASAQTTRVFVLVYLIIVIIAIVWYCVRFVV